jgi:hypothetical protein
MRSDHERNDRTQCPVPGSGNRGRGADATIATPPTSAIAGNAILAKTRPYLWVAILAALVPGLGTRIRSGTNQAHSGWISLRPLLGV